MARPFPPVDQRAPEGRGQADADADRPAQERTPESARSGTRDGTRDGTRTDVTPEGEPSPAPASAREAQPAPTAAPAATPHPDFATARDPLRKAGDWQDATILAENPDGTTEEVDAKEAVRSLMARYQKALKLMDCLNAGS